MCLTLHLTPEQCLFCDCHCCSISSYEKNGAQFAISNSEWLMQTYSFTSFLLALSLLPHL